jgi:Zn-dependent peptidase ImmA (M78 family)
MVTLLESKGFIITSFETSTTDIDAFSQYFEIEGRPVFIIAFSNNKNSAARINFDLAHELGHILLHEWSEDNENISREDFKQHEKEANAFAAAFLLPENRFTADLKFMPSDLGHYIELKKKWRVSIAAMLHRACELGIITQNQYQYNLRIMNAKGQRVTEPLDDVIAVSYPSMLSNAVSLLVDSKVFTKAALVKEFANYGLAMNPEELEKLLSLQKGYLSDDETEDSNPFILRIKQE